MAPYIPIKGTMYGLGPNGFIVNRQGGSSSGSRGNRHRAISLSSTQSTHTIGRSEGEDEFEVIEARSVRKPNQMPQSPEDNNRIDNLIRTHRHSRVQNGVAGYIINLDDLEEALEEVVFPDETPSSEVTSPLIQRWVCTPVTPPWHQLDKFQVNGSTIRSGKTVELQDGSFLLVSSIIQNAQTDEVKLRGKCLRRCTEVGGKFRKALNELYFDMQVILEDKRSIDVQNLIETDVKDVCRLRVLQCTNALYPEYRFEKVNAMNGSYAENMNELRKNERLVARYKFITTYDTFQLKEKQQDRVYPIHVRNCRIESLTKEECTPGLWKDPAVLRFNWRGDTQLGGSGSQQSNHKKRRHEHYPHVCGRCDVSFEEPEELVDHFEKEHQNHYHTSRTQYNDDRPATYNDEVEILRSHLNTELRLRERKRLELSRYTFGDAFCGAGGTTRGAVMAGLKIQYGIDKDKDACLTWERNFSAKGGKIYEIWAHEFVQQGDQQSRFIVDILHLSPPCQVFSPAHVCVGRDDVQNFDSLFAVEEIIKLARPRIITLEQTFGLLHPKFDHAFNTVIQALTFWGYSVSWQLTTFSEYGLAQSRRRLIIVAACPGETLPEFPAPTHGPRAAKPFNTVKKVLSTVRPNDPNHSPTPRSSNRFTRWDADCIVPCITTCGGAKGHPDGSRGFTIREIAALQSFPREHVFHGFYQKRQIGNAVPPLVAKILYTAIVKHLQKVDGVSETEPDIIDLTRPDPIVID